MDRDCAGCHVPIKGIVHRVGGLVFCSGCNRDMIARAVRDTRKGVVDQGWSTKVVNVAVRGFIRAMQEGE